MPRRGKLTSGMVKRSLRPTRPAPAVRTCVGCRACAAKSDLLRVVGRGGEIVPDPRARLPGRGAYLHLSQECFEQAVRRRAFARALRLPGPLATGALDGVSGAAELASHGQRPPGRTAARRRRERQRVPESRIRS